MWLGDRFSGICDKECEFEYVLTHKDKGNKIFIVKVETLDGTDLFGIRIVKYNNCAIALSII